MPNSSSELLYPDWQAEYKGAMLELDRAKLSERVALAHKAIAERLNILAQHHFGAPDERQAISDALNGLAMLEREFERQPSQWAAPDPTFCHLRHLPYLPTASSVDDFSKSIR